MTISKHCKELGTLLPLGTNINLVTMSPKCFLRHESRAFAALSEKLFAAAAQFLGNRWHCFSDKNAILKKSLRRTPEPKY